MKKKYEKSCANFKHIRKRRNDIMATIEAQLSKFSYYFQLKNKNNNNLPTIGLQPKEKEKGKYRVQ
jgi:hypothetical protein